MGEELIDEGGLFTGLLRTGVDGLSGVVQGNGETETRAFRSTRREMQLGNERYLRIGTESDPPDEMISATVRDRRYMGEGRMRRGDSFDVTRAKFSDSLCFYVSSDHLSRWQVCGGTGSEGVGV